MRVETNTFQNENFEYPNVCARCVKNEPTVPWKLRYYTFEQPDGIATAYNDNRRVYNTYVCLVPICAACHSELKRQRRLRWGMAALLGGGVGLGVMQYLLATSSLKPAGIFVTAGAAAVVAVGVIGYILDNIVAAWGGFAKYDGRSGTLRFQNKEYQAAFEKLNFLNRVAAR